MPLKAILENNLFSWNAFKNSFPTWVWPSLNKESPSNKQTRFSTLKKLFGLAGDKPKKSDTRFILFVLWFPNHFCLFAQNFSFVAALGPFILSLRFHGFSSPSATTPFILLVISLSLMEVNKFIFQLRYWVSCVCCFILQLGTVFMNLPTTWDWHRVLKWGWACLFYYEFLEWMFKIWGFSWNFRTLWFGVQYPSATKTAQKSRKVAYLSAV